MTTWPKWSKTTWIGLLVPLLIVIVRIPSEEILFKIFGDVNGSVVFMSPLFFPSPTVKIGDAYHHDIGSQISMLAVLSGFMVFIGGLLYRTSSPKTSRYLMRWALGTSGYLGYLLLFEIPAWNYAGQGNPDFAAALVIGHGFAYLLALVVVLIEGGLVFVFWLRSRKVI